MEEFYIPSVQGSGGLLFFDRSPADPSKALESFSIRVTDHQLEATAKVYAGFTSHPTELFFEMAEKWSGWPGQLSWESLEGELAIRCSHDRFGHISIRIELRSGLMDDDWCVQVSVMAEVGQLQSIANRAPLFFGKA